MCIAGSVGRGCSNQAADVRTVQILLNLNAFRLPDCTPLEPDGLCGDKTVTAIRLFQELIAVSPVNGRLDPDCPPLKALAAGLAPGYAAEKLPGVMIHARPRTVATFAEAIGAQMSARGIDTPLRQAHFLAQIGHESGELRYTEEIASGDAYEGRRDLGNSEPGDGRRFKGRGLIQLTGRANYRAYGLSIGVDLLAGDAAARVATDPALAVDVACWFWTTRRLNELADRDDVEAITRRINGGLNGLDDRKRLLARARFFLAA
jgi:putative chitinase